MIKVRTILCCLFLMGMTVCLTAQKFGYINSTEIIALHPDVRTADQQLEEFQKQLVSQGESMVSTFEANYNAYVAEANEGKLSQIQMQEKESKLTQEQEKIRAFQQKMQQDILIKRQELYQPILDKIQTAVDEVGAEGEYTMIFDSSAGSIVFAPEGDDILDKVKAKLNL